jgi:WD40 repeat protein
MVNNQDDLKDILDKLHQQLDFIQDKTSSLTDSRLHPLSGHTSYVACLTFSPNGRRIDSGSLDKTIRLWDGETGGIVGKLIQARVTPYSFIINTRDNALFVVVNGNMEYVCLRPHKVFVA